MCVRVCIMYGYHNEIYARSVNLNFKNFCCITRCICGATTATASWESTIGPTKK